MHKIDGDPATTDGQVPDAPARPMVEENAASNKCYQHLVEVARSTHVVAYFGVTRRDRRGPAWVQAFRDLAIASEVNVDWGSGAMVVGRVLLRRRGAPRAEVSPYSTCKTLAAAACLAIWRYLTNACDRMGNIGRVSVECGDAGRSE